MDISNLSKKKRLEWIAMLNGTMQKFENNIERRMEFSKKQEWKEIKKPITKTTRRIKNKEEGER